VAQGEFKLEGQRHSSSNKTPWQKETPYPSTTTMSSSSQRFSANPIKISTILLRVPESNQHNFSHVKVLLDENGSIPSFQCGAPAKWFEESSKFIKTMLPCSADSFKFLGIADDVRDQPFAKTLLVRDTYLVFSIAENQLREKRAKWVYTSRLSPSLSDHSKVLTNHQDYVYWNQHVNHVMKRLGLHGHSIL